MKPSLVFLLLVCVCRVVYSAEQQAPDCHADLQKALDRALSEKTAVVSVPAGIHPIRKALKIYSNTTLELSPQATIRREFENTADYYPMIEIAEGASNVTIRGGTFDGNGDQYHAEPFDIIFGIALKSLTIEKVIFLDVFGYHVIDFAASEDVLIRDCKFLGLKPRDKETHPREAIQVDPYFDKGGKPSVRIRVEDCVFAASGTPGFSAPAVGIGNHYAGRDAAGKFHRDIKISNNTFEGCAYAGVRVCNFENTVIAGNTFKGCGTGISVMPKQCAKGSEAEGGNGLIVSGNDFRECSVAGMRFEPLKKGTPNEAARHRQIAISGNVFAGSPGAPAIALWWCADVAVSGNVATDVKTFVVQDSAERVVVAGNAVTETR